MRSLAVGAWNLPPAMHRLSYLTGAVAVLTAVLTLVYGQHWPLVARLALMYTVFVGVLVAVAASTRRTARAWRGMFHKNPTTGSIAWPYVLLFWPYHLTVQWVCFFYRTSSGENVYDKITDQLYLGGWPLTRAMLPSANCALIDCTNELLRWVTTPAYLPVFVFESWAPEPPALDSAADWALEQQAAGRDVFCHCTHGHGRSAIVAAAILMAMGQAGNSDEALAKVVKARPGVKPNYRQIALFREWAARRAAQAHRQS